MFYCRENEEVDWIEVIESQNIESSAKRHITYETEVVDFPSSMHFQLSTIIDGEI